MIVFLNGRFVPEEEAVVSVFDRGFLYGDGLFETLVIRHGGPFRWWRHIERLRKGAALLRIKLPFNGDTLLDVLKELLLRNSVESATLRIHVSRGAGPRGYSPAGADSPTVLLTLHPAAPVDPDHPPARRLVTSSFRVPANDALVQAKATDKLRNILARSEAEEQGADEALLLNTNGTVAEAAGANLLWIAGGAVRTPPLLAGALEGVTRAVVIELGRSLGLDCREAAISPADLVKADGVFLTMSTQGVLEAVSLDGNPLARSRIVQELSRAYWRLVDREARRSRA